MNTEKQRHDTHFDFFADTKSAWESMYQDCLQAKESIEYEQYIVHDDENGARFMKLFAQKAREGVKIRLLLDKIGSRSLVASDLVEDIIKAGGRVFFYNPVNWLNLLTPGKWFPRNHTKTMLIDSKIAHISSACLADYMADWKDLHARCTGSLVKQVEQDFIHAWSRWAEFQESPPRPEDTNALYRYVIAKPGIIPGPIYRELLRTVNRARSEILIATPYFLAPFLLRRALRRAVRRGVNVRIIVTKETDVPLAVYVSYSYFPSLLRRGINLFFYKDKVYHSKYVIIDHDWATMGSTNIDYLSLLRNREANIIIRDPQTISVLRRQFDNDIENSAMIYPDIWEKMPFWQKLIGIMGRAVKRIL